MWTKHIHPYIFLFYLQRTTHFGPGDVKQHFVAVDHTFPAIFFSTGKTRRFPRRRWNLWIMGCEGEELVLWSLFSASVVKWDALTNGFRPRLGRERDGVPLENEWKWRERRCKDTSHFSFEVCFWLENVAHEIFAHYINTTFLVFVGVESFHYCFSGNSHSRFSPNGSPGWLWMPSKPQHRHQGGVWKVRLWASGERLQNGPFGREKTSQAAEKKIGWYSPEN